MIGDMTSPFRTIRNFVTLDRSRGVDKGYIVTNSTFSAGAVEFSKNKPIVLIDMQRLMRMNRGTLSLT